MSGKRGRRAKKSSKLGIDDDDKEDDDDDDDKRIRIEQGGR